MKTPPKTVRNPAYKARRADRQRARYLESIGGQYKVRATKRDALLALIVAKAAQPDGFATQDADNAKYAGKLITPMLAAGELHKFRISRAVRYFATMEAGLAYKATAAKPAKLKRKLAISPGGLAVREIIKRLSATPGGFRLSDAGSGSAIACNVVGDWIQSGELHQVKVMGSRLRYFASAALAKAFVAGYIVPSKPERQAYSGELKPAKPLRNALVFRGPTSLRPKVAEPVEIIYPERYAKSSRMMGLGRYAVDVPMVRIGSPGWSMSVGGAA